MVQCVYMGKFRGAERAPQKEIGLKFTMAEMLQNALKEKGVSAAKQEVSDSLAEDQSAVQEVGNDDSPEVIQANKEANEALLKNAAKTEVNINKALESEEQVPESGLQKLESNQPDTEDLDKAWESLSPAERRKTFRVVEGDGARGDVERASKETGVRDKVVSQESSTEEIDEGWEKLRIKSEAPSTEDLDQAWDEPAYDSAEMRRTLRGGFEPVVIEGGKGQTVIAEQGPTGTLFGDQAEIAKAAGVEAVEPTVVDEGPSIRVGEDYLSAEEMEGLDDETMKELKNEKEEEMAGVSLREALDEDEEMRELKNEKIEEPLSLREMMEKEAEEDEVKPVPKVTPEGGVDLAEEVEMENDRADDEERLMSLLDDYQKSEDRSEESVRDLMSKVDEMAEDYKNKYGEEEFLTMRDRFADKLDSVFTPAKSDEKPPAITPESAEAKSLRETQEDDGFSIWEQAAAVAGAAAAAKAVEKSAKTVVMPAREMQKNEIKDTPIGAWHEGYARGGLDESRWRALLTQSEKKAYKELQLDILDQEEHLENLKQAKSAMEKALRNELGDQFEVSARAQKMLREKAGQIAKVEALLMKSKQEQEYLIERAKERLNEGGSASAEALAVSEALKSYNEQTARNKAWELEEFPAKTSWWKKHPKMRKAAIAGGVLGGGLLFAGAWVASKLLKPIFHPFKTLEFLGNAANKMFKFLERSIVKGDPIGAVQDSVKSAERFFGEKMQKAEAKQKKGINYATTE